MSNQNYVLVLDTNRKPLNPCRPVTARKLLKVGKAAFNPSRRTGKSTNGWG